MERRPPDFASLLDHLAGHAVPAVGDFLAAEGATDERLAAARRLIAAMRRSATAPRLTRAQLRRASRIYRSERGGAKEKVSFLRLVFDSLASPAPALRAPSGAPAGTSPATRFLRFAEAGVTVELQLTRSARGIDLFGQILPAGFSGEARLEGDGWKRSAQVNDDGTFRFARLPRGKGPFDLSLGTVAVRGIEP